jgi:hypothetical protein
MDNGPVPHKSVAHLGDSLDAKAAELARQGPQPRHHAIDGVVGDRPAAPAGGDQIVAAQRLAAGRGEGDQHLHDQRLHDLAPLAVRHLATRRPDFRVAQNERPHMRKIDGPRAARRARLPPPRQNIR